MAWNPSNLLAALESAIWDRRLDELTPARAAGLRLLRLLLVLGRDLVAGQLTLRAMSLVYTTLLAIVPLLALSFSVLKAFGVYNQIGPMLARFLSPLGEKGEEISQRIIEFIQNLNVGVLGSVGLALLVYTSVALLQKIETSFNYIWHITQARSLRQRFASYLSALLIGPLLVFSALGLTASLASARVVQDVLALEPLGSVFYQVGRLMPYLMVIGAFTFLYVFLPNTKVRLGPALAGGIVGGVLWQSAGWAFAEFVATSTRYSAIYSSFAILVLFMIWVYLSWLILLLGASVTFYVQQPEYVVASSGEPRLSNRMRERLALMVMSLIGEHHLTGAPPWSLAALTQRLRVPMYAVQTVIDALRQGGLLAESSDDPPTYLPARDLEGVRVKTLLDIVRAAGEDGFLSPATLPTPDGVESVLRQIDAGAEHALDGLTLRALARAESAPPDAGAT